MEPSRKREGFSFTGGGDRVSAMTPEEELKKLNRLIHQYETVSRTTRSAEQRERVEKQLKELRGYRQKILDVNVIDTSVVEEAPPPTNPLAEYRHLARLLKEEAGRAPQERLPSLAAKDEDPTPAQEEIYNLMLYARFFQAEFLPFLTEKRLKLDFKFSLDRDGFYGRFQELERKLSDFREENARLIAGVVSREMELEMRRRITKLKRLIESDAARFFSAVEAFCEELIEDVKGDGVKCLNGSEQIAFDNIEGDRLLEGRKVREALAELAGLSSEIVAYLNVPDIDSQESGRADRY